MDRRHRRGDEQPKRQEPRSVEDFERALEEEIQVSTDFDLPLSILIARSRDGWSPEATRRAVGVLRQGDLIAQPAPAEIAIALPNTKPEDAEVVERRLRKALPEAAVGITAHNTGDKVSDLLNRARTAVKGGKQEPSG